MTPDQIIAEIWNLSWYQVLKVAIYDDFILLCKIWPVYVILIVCILFSIALLKIKFGD